ncbi:hypothetical protein BH18VER1_BH18VER1_09870 [soil metagenome]
MVRPRVHRHARPGVALALPNRLIAWSGWIYFSLAVFVPAHRWLRRRALARFDGITKSEHQL